MLNKKNSFKSFLVFIGLLVCCQLSLPSYGSAKQDSRQFELSNKHIKATFSADESSCKLTRISRKDNSDVLEMESDEFEIVLFDKSRLTTEQFDVAEINYGKRELEVVYNRRSDVSKKAPAKVTVRYIMDEEPYLYKDIQLEMEEDQKVDRLQVMRFSTDQKASRGGFGQPVFINNWFFGVNYPCFHSRHSNNFIEPDFHYRWHFTIDLEGGDKEYAPREGLVSFFHFPGMAKKQDNERWGIKGKRAVIGIAEKKHDGSELALLDYIEKNRKPARSYLHFNNWYSPEAKQITVDGFVNDIALGIKTNLEKYGAKLDAMVPDDGWQKIRNFERVYEPIYDLANVNKELREHGIDFGIWIAIDGTSTNVNDGAKIGYDIANPEEFKEYQKRTSYWGPQRYFNILNKKYQDDYKKAAKYLLEECDVRYIKHDFNHKYTYNHLSERHAREACLDVTLDLMEYERQLNPNVIINYTNGTFFTPFWLLYAEYLWMNSGDTGTNEKIAQICKLDDATSYRDNHFYLSFNNPERTVRPIIPIANFMTHGILHSGVRYYNPDVDPIQDWLNYVVMYYGRGTLIKELYISPDLMTEDMWKALGTASAWAQQNEDNMRNTVLVGGDAGKGEVYGYISWQRDNAVLTVRNPIHQTQILNVPFDETVYYRGKKNKQFCARAVYPFVEELPWELVSGESFSVSVPGNSVLVYEISKGKAKTDEVVVVKDLPPVVKSKCDKNSYSITLKIPDEEFPHYELFLYHGVLGNIEPSQPMVNGKPLQLKRSTKSGEIITTYDLRSFRGKTITIAGKTASEKECIKQAWLVADRKVQQTLNTKNSNDVLPWAIGQNYRRITQQVLFK